MQTLRALRHRHNDLVLYSIESKWTCLASSVSQLFDQSADLVSTMDCTVLVWRWVW